MSQHLLLLTMAITAASAVLMAMAALVSMADLVRGRGTNAALDAMRIRLAGGIITALGLLTAGTLLKSLTLDSWSALGLFALVFALRLLIKRSLGLALRSAEPR